MIKTGFSYQWDQLVCDETFPFELLDLLFVEAQAPKSQTV